MSFKLQLLHRATSASVAKVAAEFFGHESLEMAILGTGSLDTPKMGRHLRFGRENRVGALWSRKFENAKFRSRKSGHVVFRSRTFWHAKSLLRKSEHESGTSNRSCKLLSLMFLTLFFFSILGPLVILKPVCKVWLLTLRVLGFCQQTESIDHWSSKNQSIKTSINFKVCSNRTFCAITSLKLLNKILTAAFCLYWSQLRLGSTELFFF